MPRAGRAERRRPWFWRGTESTQIHEGEIDLIGVADISEFTDASLVAHGDALFQGVAEVPVSGSLVAGGDVGTGLIGVATFTAEPLETIEGEATLQAVAAITADASEPSAAEATVTAVATFSSDGVLGHGGQAALQAVATFDSFISEVDHVAEADLQCVAHMGFDPDLTPRPTHWFRREYPPYVEPRVRGEMETTGSVTVV